MDGNSESVQLAAVYVGLQFGTGRLQCIHRVLCKRTFINMSISNHLLSAFAILHIYKCAAMIIAQSGSLFTCIIGGEHTLRAHYLLIFSKYTEIIETFIFVLRKKQSQVSTLHVYHHFIVVAMPTLSMHIEPGEQ